MRLPAAPYPCAQESPPARADLIALDAACALYGIARSTMFRYLKLGLLHGYEQRGDRNTQLDRRELQDFFAICQRNQRD